MSNPGVPENYLPILLFIGVGIALGTIAVPLLGVLAFTQSANLNDLNRRDADPSGGAGWVAYFLTVAFIAQAIYFGSVAYYALIDTIRSTSAGNEQPPTLTWNIVNLGAALGGLNPNRAKVDPFQVALLPLCLPASLRRPRHLEHQRRTHPSALAARSGRGVFDRLRG